RFKQALSSARKQGELGAGKDPDALAALLMSSIWGLRVLGGTAPQPQRARAVVGQLMTLLD
ncbi:MAG: hypothetical protein ABW149_16055, partial [Sedimenticola sp.]